MRLQIERSDTGWRMAVFLVDRVLPGLTAGLLGEAQRCLRDAARRLSGDGEAVRYLRCSVVHEEQRCLDLFEAASAAAVRRVNDVAQVPYRSISAVTEYDMEEGVSDAR